MQQQRRTRRQKRQPGVVSDVPTAIFTIVSRNYISYAVTLMQTVAQHHPEAARIIFIADERYDYSGLDVPADIVTADSIGIERFPEMAFRYSVIELNTAVKPFCFRWLLRQRGHIRVIYLDPDIYLLRPLVGVTELLDQGGQIVLIPHITSPLQDGHQPDDLTIMKSGIYNLGFAAFARTEAVDRFVDWWAARLERHCRVDLPNYLFLDQRWMDLAPAFVPNTAILRHPGYNLAYWNLLHRPITFDVKRGWKAAGQPLHFVHFSGVDPRKPGEFSKHQNRFTIETIGGLRPLFERYVEKLLANGYEKFITAPYAYARFADGREIHWLMRNCFRRMEDSGEWPGAASPITNSGIYDTIEPSLATPGLPDITRVMHQLWLERRDLRDAFSLDTAEGRIAYLRWFVETAQPENGIDDQSLLAAAAIGGKDVRQLVPTRLRNKIPRREPPWLPEEPWQGPAVQADVYLRGRTRLRDLDASLPRQFAIIWHQREDLQDAFPLRTADEIDSYVRWCLTDGIAQNQIVPELINSEFWDELSAPAALGEQYDDIPITRGLWLFHRYCDQVDAVAQFPEDRSSRIKLSLWFMLEAPVRFRWPREMTSRLRDWAAEPVGSMLVDGVALPRLLLIIREVRSDLRTSFDLENASGRLGLVHWFLFHGLREYGLAIADLPDYFLQALAQEANENGESLPPLLHRLILLQRGDVASAFDIATQEGRRLYRDWFIEHGVVELNAAILNGLRLARPATPQAPTIMPSRPERPQVVLTGCLSEPSGRGEDMRMTMAALDVHGIPYLTIDRLDKIARDQAGNILEPDAVADAAVNIVHLNADTAFADYMFLRQYGVHRARVVGYWAWELAKFPEEYRTAFSFFDEIWASTRFAFSAFDTGHRPVTLMPMPVALPERMTNLSRGHFRLPENRFLFLFNFDFGSFCARKNPEAAIAAFRAAFPSDPQVGLVIKTINAERFTEQWNWLKEAAGGDRRIIMRNGRYTRDEMLNLIRLCDCYVSLHRSEGFGRGPAEAMLLGRPVVATNYSGNVDFMNAENSFPVDYRLVPVREGEYPGARGQVWAEPDIAHAAAQMERVYHDQAEARRMAKEAARLIATRYSARAIGANYVRWLQQIFPELHGARSRRDRRRRTRDPRAVATVQGAAAAQ